MNGLVSDRISSKLGKMPLPVSLRVTEKSLAQHTPEIRSPSTRRSAWHDFTLFEQCDDSNGNDGDGCSSSCRIECGFTCNCPDGTDGSASVCTSTCGDGVKALSEACDDGNLLNGDGCSESCTIEDGFSCLPLTCHKTHCTDMSSVVQVAAVEDLVCAQQEEGVLSTRWSHPYLDLVTQFEVHCDHASPGAATANATVTVQEACSGYICQFTRSAAPGQTVSCSVRVMIQDLGWSPVETCSVFILGPPSAPQLPTIKHASTMTFLNTRWCFAWSDSMNHGDGKAPGAPDRTQIVGHDIKLQCGDKQLNLVTGSLRSMCVVAYWHSVQGSRECDDQAVPQKFEIFDMSYANSLVCERKQTMRYSVRAKNTLFSGNWSETASVQVLGLPARVIDLSTTETADGIAIKWTEVSKRSSLCLLPRVIKCSN